MEPQPFSNRVTGIANSIQRLIQIATDSAWSRSAGDLDISDFMLGNPHEMPLPGFVAAMQRWLPPQNENWFAYKFSEPAAREAVAASLRQRLGAAFEPDDISITNGAFAGLAAVLAAVTDPGDEVIFNLPPWFFYESLILTYNATPVKVKVDPRTFDLDLDAIAAALGPRTRAIIVNSPNNPTGRIYPPALLERLGRLLTEASQRFGRTIYLISDEAYHRIVYDNHRFPSPAVYYPESFLVYTYGKQLLTPGERLGYIALPPGMAHRPQMRLALMAAQSVTGHAFGNGVLQYALPELDALTVDIAHLQRKRDRIVSELRRLGYDVTEPQGTFYVLVRSPLADDVAFTELLARRKIFCLPGAVFEWPGTFRISLTASDAMIDRALPGFSQVLAEVQSLTNAV
jgi:aspartate aminotransferase